MIHDLTCAKPVQALVFCGIWMYLRDTALLFRRAVLFVVEPADRVW